MFLSFVPRFLFNNSEGDMSDTRYSQALNNSNDNNNHLDLEIKKLTKRFGGLTAVSDFNFQLKKGAFFSLIGPNGAGKTTVFNLLTGVLKSDSGNVIFQGNDVTNLPPHLISARGIVRTFQNIRLLHGMNVIENIRAVFHNYLTYSFPSAIFTNQVYQQQEKEMNEKIEEMIKTFNLAEYRHTNVSDLAYGIQRKVEIVRAVAYNPKVLLLDEPTAGLTPAEADEIIKMVMDIKDKIGFSVIIVEHDMRLVMAVSERITVMDNGKVIAQGTPDEVQNNEDVIMAYLGKNTFKAKK
jgi:branched-chain amino acid transport system ATP-binding protein